MVNLSGHPAQAQVQAPWPDLEGKTWRLTDSLSEAAYDREGSGMRDPGLYVELGPWGSHCFHCRAAGPRGASTDIRSKEKVI